MSSHTKLKNQRKQPAVEQFLFSLLAKHGPNDTDSGEGIKGGLKVFYFFLEFVDFALR